MAPPLFGSRILAVFGVCSPVSFSFFLSVSVSLRPTSFLAPSAHFRGRVATIG